MCTLTSSDTNFVLLQGKLEAPHTFQLLAAVLEYKPTQIDARAPETKPDTYFSTNPQISVELTTRMNSKNNRLSTETDS